MQNPFATPTASNLGFLAIRVSLGAYLVVGGVAEIRSQTIATFIETNLPKVQPILGRESGQIFLAMFLPVAIAAGLSILAGFLTRTAAFIACCLLLCAIYAKWKPLDPMQPIHVNIVLLSIAIMLLTNGGGNYTIPNLIGKKGGGKPPAPPAK